MGQNRIRIKMCGMTRKQDIVKAVSLGVDAIGLVFYAKSARYVSLEQAKELLHESPVFVDVVAVLVNPEIAFVNEIITKLPIQWLQFHGEETSEFCAQFQKPYIKAVPAVSAQRIEYLSALHPQAAAILLDTPAINDRGGTGELFNWELIPAKLKQSMILAGGLDPSNISQVSKIDTLYAVDVCTGIEVSPGIKDHHKMRQFVHALWGKA